ncbi:hypothetical protein L218DRAFT_987817 [Marasmius fiardii PR-910]|nr:hypothetical protein L218DRAFT_987817 [Marasmius fiardii PR-910]
MNSQQNLVTHEIPSNVHADWKRYAETNQIFLSTLASHAAMAPNLQQTYMTPANSKNKIYFMWDFVGRSLGMLFTIPPEKNPRRGMHKATWSDVVGRTVMAKKLLIEDQVMLNSMVERTYPDQRGQHPILGEEVLDAARNLP